MFTEKEVKLVKSLGEIVAGLQKGVLKVLNESRRKLSVLETRIRVLEESDTALSKEFFVKRVTERINVGNDKDFIYELAKRVEKLEDKME